MRPWSWTPRRQVGIWRYGAPWLRPLVAFAPYLSVVLCLMMMHFVSGTIVRGRGVAFELPEGGLSDGERTELVALVMPMSGDTMVFFDDSRYMLSETSWQETLVEHLSERIVRSESKTLLVLVDCRVKAEVLLNLAAVAKRSGVGKVVFAEKRAQSAE